MEVLGVWLISDNQFAVKIIDKIKYEEFIMNYLVKDFNDYINC